MELRFASLHIETSWPPLAELRYKGYMHDLFVSRSPDEEMQTMLANMIMAL